MILKQAILTIFVEELNTTAMVLADGTIVAALITAGQWQTKAQFIERAQDLLWTAEAINKRIVVYDIDGKELLAEAGLKSMLGLM